MIKRSRPTCPNCGSIDIDLKKKTGKCRNCGCIRPALKFTSGGYYINPENTEIIGEGVRRRIPTNKEG